MQQVFVVSSLQGTYQLAAQIASMLSGGVSLGLCGPLGAGKTELVRGILKALGVKELVTSPTFVLEHIFSLPNSPLQLHHWDLYRLGSPVSSASQVQEPQLQQSPAQQLGLLESLQETNRISLIEWPERDPAVLKQLSAVISIGFPSANEESREFCFSQVKDERIAAALQEFKLTT